MPRICRPSIQKSILGPGRELRGREVRVAEPARVRGGTEEPARVEEEPAREEDPVAERVQTRERDVPRAQEERDHEVEEGRAQRHHGQEDHGGAVHGEQLVEGLGAHQRVVRPGELRRISSASRPPIRKKAKAVVP